METENKAMEKLADRFFEGETTIAEENIFILLSLISLLAFIALLISEDKMFRPYGYGNIVENKVEACEMKE